MKTPPVVVSRFHLSFFSFLLSLLTLLLFPPFPHLQPMHLFLSLVPSVITVSPAANRARIQCICLSTGGVLNWSVLASDSVVHDIPALPLVDITIILRLEVVSSAYLACQFRFRVQFHVVLHFVGVEGVAAVELCRTNWAA